MHKITSDEVVRYRDELEDVYFREYHCITSYEYLRQSSRCDNSCVQVDQDA